MVHIMLVMQVRVDGIELNPPMSPVTSDDG